MIAYALLPSSVIFNNCLGMGSSATMVASLCMTATYANTNGYGGGSVYSAVTFLDKLISGIVVVIIQYT